MSEHSHLIDNGNGADTPDDSTARTNELANWSGEVEDLIGSEELLSNDPDLCDRVFMNRHEAFLAGSNLGAASQKAKVSDLTEQFRQLAWGDVGPAIQHTRDTLELLMLITRDGFDLWETELADKEFISEFDVPVEYAIELPLEKRFAHVARLIRSLSMHYGLRTDYAVPPEEVLEVIGDIQDDSPAWILDQLDRSNLNAPQFHSDTNYRNAATERRDRDDQAN